MEVNTKNTKEWKNVAVLYVHTAVFNNSHNFDVCQWYCYSYTESKVPIWTWFTLFSIDPYFLTLEDEEQPESFSLFCIGLNKCGGSLVCEVEHGIAPKLSSQHLCLSNAKWLKLISCSTNKFLKNCCPIILFHLVWLGLPKQLFRC